MLLYKYYKQFCIWTLLSLDFFISRKILDPGFIRYPWISVRICNFSYIL